MWQLENVQMWSTAAETVKGHQSVLLSNPLKCNYIVTWLPDSRRLDNNFIVCN